ncbi:MAG TPA: CoA pyrophosphatase [Thermoanaerobaculia bacterium]|nr:CoA pyrophosphatase [Thermoanaerobaculia bacterium]
MSFTLDLIRQALAAHHPPQLAEREPYQAEAAVALVLAGRPEPALCVIRRAERAGDPWSGHLALPGGRADPEDPHPRAMAERETMEEVGIALAERHWLGALSQLLVRLGGGGGRMVLHSFVYALDALDGEPPPFTLSDEVAAAFWVPLAELWDPANGCHVEWERDGTRLLYPAIRCQGQAIWGLTFRVLTLFSDALGAPLPHLEEIPSLGR